MKYKINLKNRKKVESLVYQIMDAMDPSGTNTKRYKRLFQSMSDSKFEQFMKTMFDDENIDFTLEIVDFDRELTIKQCQKAADILKIPLEEYVILPHISKSQEKPIVTKEKCIVGWIIDKRMEQMNTKKNSTSTHIDERSATTGQVVGHDKNGRSSDQENIALVVIGAKDIMREVNGFRADGLQRKNFAYAQIAKTGSCSLEDIEQEGGIEDRLALETVDTYYMTMGLGTDLITPSNLLITTIKEKRGVKK